MLYVKGPQYITGVYLLYVYPKGHPIEKKSFFFCCMKYFNLLQVQAGWNLLQPCRVNMSGGFIDYRAVSVAIY